jgi:hypothetical protein
MIRDCTAIMELPEDLIMKQTGIDQATRLRPTHEEQELLKKTWLKWWGYRTFF